MKTPNIINTLTRRAIRYVFSRKQLFEIEGNEFEFNKYSSYKDILNLNDKKANTVLKFYESQENFDGWENFMITWDIGIEDVSIMASRPDKFYLFGIKKTKIVNIKDKPCLLVPSNGDQKLSNKVAFTLQKIDLAVYNGIKENNKIFFNKILEKIETRNNWLEEGLKLESERKLEQEQEEKLNKIKSEKI